MTRENSQLRQKDPTNFLPKVVANYGKNLFFGSSPDFGEKLLQFPSKTFFLFLVFFPFRRRKYIISIKLFVKLVKAAKASHHTNFYNLSTVDEKIAISVDANIDWRLLPVCCCCSCTEQCQMQTIELST